MELTIFTPTYNRRDLLPRAYESLLRQTCRDFVWLIVDDGSSDDTETLVKNWQTQNALPIIYKYYENGGKMRAHNRGVELAETPLFLCLDSDDYLTDTAVEELLACWHENATRSHKRPLAGIVSHKGRSKKELLGACDFPDTGDTTLYGLYLKGFRGETTLLFVTDVLRKFPFPEIEGEKYVPEDYIYDKIDEVYDLCVLPKITTVCEIVSAGYTDSVRKLKVNNPQAWYLYYEQRSRITPKSLLRCKYLGYYVVYALRCGQRPADNKAFSRLDIIAGYIFAGLLKGLKKE